MAISCPIVAVGAVLWRGPDHLLLVRRGTRPRQGEWSIPGGRVEAGETLHAALTREIEEETSVTVSIEGLIDVAELVEREDGAVTAHFVLIDFSADWRSGEAVAGGDAAECRWFPPAEALARVSWEETRRIIRKSAQHRWGLHL